MIFFPGFILLIMLGMLLLLPRLQAAENAAEGLAAVFAVDAAVVASLFWSDFGCAISWDNDAVYVRQYGGRFFMKRHPYASVPYSDIRGITLHPPPRGVPPKYPLLEIDAPSHVGGPPLFIDPNYFTAASLGSFLNDLRARLPELREGMQGAAVERLLKLFAKI